MKRRHFLKAAGLLPFSLIACQYMPIDGFINPCHTMNLPKYLREHDLVRSIWDGIDVNQVWDVHTHLIGNGDSDSDLWVNPKLQSISNFYQYLQYKFYINGSCSSSSTGQSLDKTFVTRLLQLHKDMPNGFRYMLLAFDYYYTEQGKIDKTHSIFYTPNKYAMEIAQKYPNQFEWIASIHPYREDCLEELDHAVQHNARAVKWLPGAMGINPANPVCDRFYDALVKHKLPLLTHAGEERAVEAPEDKKYENPLLFRRALDRGVKVIFAHCASLGESVDTDKGSKAARVPSIELFGRLMDSTQYQNQVYGDISAVTQSNRDFSIMEIIAKREDWHDRLLYGSDYPLPGVLPVYSPLKYANWGFITENQANLLSEVRQYNPSLFDVMLKRLVNFNGHTFSPRIFETRYKFL